MRHRPSTLAIFTRSALAAATLLACGNSGGTGSTSGGSTSGGGGAATGSSSSGGMAQSASSSSSASGTSSVTGASSSSGAPCMSGASSSSGSGTGGGNPQADAQMTKFCDDITVPYCEALFACCADPKILANNGNSVAGCETKFATDCKTQISPWILPRLKAGTTALDDAALAACVATFKTMKVGGSACTRPPSFVLELDCIAAFKGKIPPCAACDGKNLPDTEYVICDKGRCDTGKCLPFLPTGATCDPAGSYAGGCNYPGGEHCAVTGATGKCGPLGKVGDVCQTPNKEKSYDCYSMSCGPAGKCIPPTAYGICTSG